MKKKKTKYVAYVCNDDAIIIVKFGSHSHAHGIDFIFCAILITFPGIQLNKTTNKRIETRKTRMHN